MWVANFLSFVLLCAAGVHCAEWVTVTDFEAQLYATGPNPRGLYVDESGDVLFLGQSARGVFALRETDNGDGTVSVDHKQLVSGSPHGLVFNHAVTHHNGYLYVSTPTGVYRYPYVAGSREEITEDPETVINNIPAGGHDSRTLVFDSENRLYVSIGSNANVDNNSDRARIRRFILEGASFPINFNVGEVFADGLRNEVGLAFDKYGRLFGVENGADQLNRPDLGGDIHNGNPAEEMNFFDNPPGTHHGYPYCFSTYNLQGHEAGTQFAWPSFMNDGVHTDEWCRNVDNNRPPVLSMPAHNAPLGVTFYNGEGCDEIPGAFPCSMEGDAFVALHGSWNSDDKVGYKVVHIPFSKSSPYLPTGEINDLLYEPNLASCNNNCLRPVNVVFNKNGHLIVSADSSSEIFKVTYKQAPKPIRN